MPSSPKVFISLPAQPGKAERELVIHSLPKNRPVSIVKAIQVADRTTLLMDATGKIYRAGSWRHSTSVSCFNSWCATHLQAAKALGIITAAELSLTLRKQKEREQEQIREDARQDIINGCKKLGIPVPPAARLPHKRQRKAKAA